MNINHSHAIHGDRGRSWKCPRCLDFVRQWPALSRCDNETKICCEFAVQEALENYADGTVSCEWVLKSIGGKNNASPKRN